MSFMDVVFGLVVGAMVAVILGVWIYLILSDFLGRE